MVTARPSGTTTVKRPVMPRCMSSASPLSSRAIRYLARRASSTIRRPSSRATKSFGSAKRRSWRARRTAVMVRPTSTGARPRRTVSTSGSSGMLVGSWLFGGLVAECRSRCTG
jgi:hypothetical protein